jgi:hypothetical protein
MTDSLSTSELTNQVFDHHLGAFAQGLDELLRDYSDDSALITPEKTYRGLDEIRGFFEAFIDSATPEFWSAFEVTGKSTEGEIGYLAWQAKPWVTLATDTLFVRNGKIMVQVFTSFTS